MMLNAFENVVCEMSQEGGGGGGGDTYGWTSVEN